MVWSQPLSLHPRSSLSWCDQIRKVWEVWASASRYRPAPTSASPRVFQVNRSLCPYQKNLLGKLWFSSPRYVTHTVSGWWLNADCVARCVFIGWPLLWLDIMTLYSWSLLVLEIISVSFRVFQLPPRYDALTLISWLPISAHTAARPPREVLLRTPAPRRGSRSRTCWLVVSIC